MLWFWYVSFCCFFIPFLCCCLSSTFLFFILFSKNHVLFFFSSARKPVVTCKHEKQISAILTDLCMCKNLFNPCIWSNGLLSMKLVIYYYYFVGVYFTCFCLRFSFVQENIITVILCTCILFQNDVSGGILSARAVHVDCSRVLVRMSSTFCT